MFESSGSCRSIVYTKNRVCLKGAVQCESAPLLNVIKFLLFLLCQEDMFIE